jgi:hypothetical protein
MGCGKGARDGCGMTGWRKGRTIPYIVKKYGPREVLMRRVPRQKLVAEQIKASGLNMMGSHWLVPQAGVQSSSLLGLDLGPVLCHARSLIKRHTRLLDSPHTHANTT